MSGNFFRESQKGQVFLIVVLVMVVALSVGLSVAARTLTNLRISTDETNSSKALFAAEAGIEQALKTGQEITEQTLDPNTTNNIKIKSVTITTLSGNTFLLNNGAPVSKDDGGDVWLSSYSTDSAKLYQNPWSGTLNIYWGGSTESCNPSITASALEIIVISGSRASPAFTRYAIDPCASTARGTANHFNAPNGSSGSVEGRSFKFSQSINVTNGLITRIIPIYNTTSIGIVGVPVNGGPALPSQGRIIVSTGSVGNTQRKISYFQGYESVPSEFFYSLFLPKP